METVRMRERRQLTLPADIVDLVQIKTNDALQVAVLNGVIQLTPMNMTKNKKISMRSFLGLAKGVYASGDQNNLSKYVEDLRNEW
jgi:bifunctional DNA-binding transcriptional regulator/antitoxin component of YhaV-PrlF toxin-antitoxin module